MITVTVYWKIWTFPQKFCFLGGESSISIALQYFLLSVWEAKIYFWLVSEFEISIKILVSFAITVYMVFCFGVKGFTEIFLVFLEEIMVFSWKVSDVGYVRESYSVRFLYRWVFFWENMKCWNLLYNFHGIKFWFGNKMKVFFFIKILWNSAA